MSLPKIAALGVATVLLCVSSLASADVTILNWDFADYCDENLGTWNECAPVALMVPEGETATLDIETTATFYEDDVSQSVLMCIGVRSASSSDPASCISGAKAGVDLDVSEGSVGDDLESAATTVLYTLQPGTYIIASLIAPYDDELDIEPLDDVGRVRTKVRAICENCAQVSAATGLSIVNVTNASPSFASRPASEERARRDGRQ